MSTRNENGPVELFLKCVFITTYFTVKQHWYHELKIVVFYFSLFCCLKYINVFFNSQHILLCFSYFRALWLPACWEDTNALCISLIEEAFNKTVRLPNSKFLLQLWMWWKSKATLAPYSRNICGRQYGGCVCKVLYPKDAVTNHNLDFEWL